MASVMTKVMRPCHVRRERTQSWYARQLSTREPTPFAIARSSLLSTGVLNSRLCLLNGLLDQLQRPEPVATFVR